jgi:hypothetical protein
VTLDLSVLGDDELTTATLAALAATYGAQLQSLTLGGLRCPRLDADSTQWLPLLKGVARLRLKVRHANSAGFQVLCQLTQLQRLQVSFAGEHRIWHDDVAMGLPRLTALTSLSLRNPWWDMSTNAFKPPQVR